MDSTSGNTPPIREIADLAAPTAESTDAAFAGVREVKERTLTSAESKAVDARQDELMATESVSGRPPAHRVRRAGWGVLTMAGTALVLGGTGWALLTGMSVIAMIGVGFTVLLVLLMGGWPVWSTSLMRGREERAARKQAVSELPRRDGVVEQPPPR
ncbi:MAG: hypothetical protein JSR77_18100 [Planctomycetes bacterium]|nr:hypothetical protein [Planctomycetota bacterium]